MSETPERLDALRREIDAIDDDLLTALVRRAALIDAVAAAKRTDARTANDSAMRPDREAAILRRLAAAVGGDLPVAVVARLWREIINAATAHQRPFSVAVCAPQRSVGYWDLARNHFGSAAPMSLHRSPLQVLRRVSEDPACLGLLPLPQNEEQEAWWPGLVNEVVDARNPKVIWRLPFFRSMTGQFEDLGALVVACIPPRPTGQDIGLVAVGTSPEVSRGRLHQDLAAVGLEGQIIAVDTDVHGDERLNLVQVNSFVEDGDPRFADLSEALGDAMGRAVALGGFPVPLDAGA